MALTRAVSAAMPQKASKRKERRSLANVFTSYPDEEREAVAHYVQRHFMTA